MIDSLESVIQKLDERVREFYPEKTGLAADDMDSILVKNGYAISIGEGVNTARSVNRTSISRAIVVTLTAEKFARVAAYGEELAEKLAVASTATKFIREINLDEMLLGNGKFAYTGDSGVREEIIKDGKIWVIDINLELETIIK